MRTLGRWITGIALVTTAACGLLGIGCGQEPGPPTLVRVEVWLADIQGAEIVPRELVPRTGDGYALQKDKRYVGRVYIHMHGRSDRCLYTPFQYTWFFGFEQYSCYPETTDGVVPIDEPFSTWSYQLHGGPYHIRAALDEQDLRRNFIATYDSQTFPVTISD